MLSDRSREQALNDFLEYPQQATEGLETVIDWIRYSNTVLSAGDLCFRSGLGSAFAESNFLLAETLRMDFEDLETYATARLAASERRRVCEALVERLKTRKPMAYVLGATWYCGHRLLINDAALIPRSAIGTMLEDYFSTVDPSFEGHFLDLGTGSGGIAVAFAKAFEAATLVASECFDDALEVARSNVHLHGLEERVELRLSDLFKNFSEQERFDWILCNPPYVRDDFKQVMSPEYKFEPGPALFGGEHGLGLIRPLLSQASAYLKDDGRIFVEMGDITGEGFRERFPKAGGEWYCHPESRSPVVFMMNRDELKDFETQLSA